MNPRKHGTYAKYAVDGCRCYPCCQAASNYSCARRRAIAYGKWQPYVDAEPVRQHVRNLGEFGIGWMRLARLAGVPRGTVSKLLYGDPKRGSAPSKRLLSKNALALLAIEPTLDNMGARVPIDGTGTRRRLQALVAKGWTQSELARRLGADRTNFARTITSDLVHASTARATNTLYDELWRASPEGHGVPAHRAAAARRSARERHWAPVGAWDDDLIDSPEAYPDWTGRCGTSSGYSDHYRFHIPVCDPCRQAGLAHRRAAA